MYRFKSYNIDDTMWFSFPERVFVLERQSRWFGWEVDAAADSSATCPWGHGGAGVNGGPAPAIENLGIGPYQWNTECLRGDVEAGNATSFPQAIGLAAAFRYRYIFI